MTDKKEKISLSEFYQKYCSIRSENDKRYPAFKDADTEFFEMVHNIEKEGKGFLINKNRRFTHDAYMYSLTSTAMQLTEGKELLLLSQDPNKYIKDLKHYFDIDVDIKPSKINGEIQKDVRIITIKK